LQRFEDLRDDLDAVFSWFLDNHKPDEALRVAMAQLDFWQYTGRIGEARVRFDRALAARNAQDCVRAEALFPAGLLAFWQGDDDDARSLHGQSLDLARRLDSPTGVALALSGLARVELRSDLAHARELSRQALDAVEGIEEQSGHSNAYHVLGVSAQMNGELEEARHWMSMRLGVVREMKAYRALAGEAGNLSVVERRLSNLKAAREYGVEALSLAHRRGDEWMVPFLLNVLAAVDLANGNHERAAVSLSAAQEAIDRQNTAWPPDEAPHFEHSKAEAAKVLGPEQFEKAWSRGHRISTAAAVELALAAEPHRTPPAE
jgi:tetratricopeptide (TPR) repeat protein